MKSNRNTEELIFKALPTSPPQLRQQVERLVRKKIRRQMLLRDSQWLGLTFSAVLFALAVQWSMFVTLQAQFHEFCRTEIASEKTEQVLLTHRNESRLLVLGPPVSSQLFNENYQEQ